MIFTEFVLKNFTPLFFQLGANAGLFEMRKMFDKHTAAPFGSVIFPAIWPAVESWRFSVVVPFTVMVLERLR